MDLVTCRLTAEDRDQLPNLMLVPSMALSLLQVKLGPHRYYNEEPLG